MTPTETHKHAVVLAGGGANGAYAVGVMEAIFSGRWHQGQDASVEASIFTGTSVGAYTAALMASLFDRSCLAAVREVRRLWVDQISAPPGGENGVFRLRGRLAHALGDGVEVARDGVQRFFDLAWSDELLSQRFSRLFYAGNLVSTGPLEQLIAQTIDPQRLLDPRARSLKVITTNWDEGQVVVFHNRLEDEVFQPTVTPYDRGLLTVDNTRLVIQASAAIPGLFPAVPIGDHLYADGGVVLNAPLLPAIRAGGSVIHVIHFEPDLEPIPFGRSPSLFETLSRIALMVPAKEIRSNLHDARRIRQLRSAARRLRRVWRQLGDAADEGEDEIWDFFRDYSELPEVTVHVYYPSRKVDGISGLLNFNQDRIVELIELGYDDAVGHDCEVNGCLI